MATITETLPLETDRDGVVRVGGTRVTLDTVLAAFSEGATAEEIAQQYPALQLADIYSVIGYSLRHRAEVESYLTRRRAEAERVRAENEARFDPAGVRDRLARGVLGGRAGDDVLQISSRREGLQRARLLQSPNGTWHRELEEAYPTSNGCAAAPMATKPTIATQMVSCIRPQSARRAYPKNRPASHQAPSRRSAWERSGPRRAMVSGKMVRRPRYPAHHRRIGPPPGPVMRTARLGVHRRAPLPTPGS